MTSVASGQDRLIALLADSGVLTSKLAGAFQRAARERFVPGCVWIGGRPPLRPVLRSEEPQAWLDLVYSDTQLVTQVDDGATSPGAPGQYASSSISKPSLVARMLVAARVRPGQRVLEVGTGSGWNAALLAELAGPDGVTSLEIDPAVARTARMALASAGFAAVRVVTGDGSLGYLQRAPFDRVVATAACQRVPYPWIAQTRPGGRVVTPWGTSYFNGLLLELDVTGHDTATGRFTNELSFMWLRGQRVPFGWLAGHISGVEFDHIGETALHPYQFNHVGAALVIGLLVPGCHYHLSHDGNVNDSVMWLFDPATGSLAQATITPGATSFVIRQGGPRRLWDEATRAYQWWDERGRPGYTRFGISIDAQGGQHVYLDTQHHPVALHGG